MFDWLFKSKPKKPGTWQSVYELLQDLSHYPGGGIRNRAYFRERNFELFIDVIEKSGGEWIEWSCSPENDLQHRMYSTVIVDRSQNPLVLLEVLQYPNCDGTLVYFIDMAKAYACQCQLMQACQELEPHQTVSVKYSIEDALCAMDLLVDYDMLFTQPGEYQCKVERYRNDPGCSSILERACYRCLACKNGVIEKELCFELTGFTQGSTLRRLSEIPSSFSIGENFYKQLRRIN